MTAKKTAEDVDFLLVLFAFMLAIGIDTGYGLAEWWRFQLLVKDWEMGMTGESNPIGKHGVLGVNGRHEDHALNRNARACTRVRHVKTTGRDGVLT